LQAQMKNLLAQIPAIRQKLGKRFFLYFFEFGLFHFVG